MKKVNAVVNLVEKDFVTETGEKLKYIEMSVELASGVNVVVKPVFKSDKQVIKYIYNQK